MHAQLEILLEMQDLRSQRAALAEQDLGRVESELFDIEPDEAVLRIDEKLGELEDRLDTGVRNRYDRLKGARDRMVVPVVGGICYGCFMAVPTAWASDIERNEGLDVCDNCGCFLYHLD
ncbi:MAG: C4-type zinc ribbon domain-containing protein [Candidatus Palauibacterales bacterium]|nr:C4-type zinc ribbon domain-containing protein [Candidatus Palauibacterales bacterium]MDP2530209.1 C4-type zinc ribbon domain-containing protein [Candidatus Palauibacterales bacterium]MDP2584594.1 C4-type zinc ribbon domain-containing protein [Candidatus Palauibacterales bacterium]